MGFILARRHMPPYPPGSHSPQWPARRPRRCFVSREYTDLEETRVEKTVDHLAAAGGSHHPRGGGPARVMFLAKPTVSGEMAPDPDKEKVLDWSGDVMGHPDRAGTCSATAFTVNLDPHDPEQKR
jgi:hypothetical protein